MTRKKTIHVRELLQEANRLLALDDNHVVNDSFRQGVTSLLLTFLTKTNNYNGFNYVHWIKQGHQDWVNAGQPEGEEKEQYFGNQTRREYFMMPG